ncbi:MAG: hypothetical protein ACFFDW_10300 [Candidatus Thorarchaeota archaeon]
MREINNYQKWSFLSTIIACVIFIVFTIIAIYFYPGGSRYTSDSDGYIFTETFLSDLGRTISISGEDNTISRIFFTTAFVLLGVTAINFNISLFLFFRNKEWKIKIIAYIGVILGIISAILFCLVALFPVDLFSKVHHSTLYSGAPIKFLSFLFFTIALFMTNELPKTIKFFTLNVVIFYLLFAISILIGMLIERRTMWGIIIIGHPIGILSEIIAFISIAIILLKDSFKKGNLPTTIDKKA